MRVALYAEGPGELGHRDGAASPGHPLEPSLLGPGHALLDRSLRHLRPALAPTFVAPLRLPRGRVARGSDLHDPTSLKRLLVWPSPSLRPDLQVVLVDADGDERARRRLAEAVAELLHPPVLAVAVQEFESWLIRDLGALRSCLDLDSDPHPAEQNQRPGEAKTWLKQRCAEVGRDGATSRLDIAKALDLDRLAHTSDSYRRFREALAGRLR